MSDSVCTRCPRKCGVLRSDNGDKTGYCRVGNDAVVARAALHFYEEPCLSGKNGAGAVFFCGCNLGCVYCQNADISRSANGRRVTPDGLRRIYLDLIAQGAHNIDLVTPLHFIDALEASLLEPLPVPVIVNTGGYDSADAVARISGRVQVWLPDYKYSDASAAKKYSNAADYPQVAEKAIHAMCDASGELEFDENGVIKSGVIVRHLLLPGELENTLGCIDFIASLPKNKVMLSLMSQYTPSAQCANIGELSRRVTAEEYKKAADYAHLCGIRHGYFQELSSAERAYTPAFDLTGVGE